MLHPLGQKLKGEVQAARGTLLIFKALGHSSGDLRTEYVESVTQNLECLGRVRKP